MGIIRVAYISLFFREMLTGNPFNLCVGEDGREMQSKRAVLIVCVLAIILLAIETLCIGTKAIPLSTIYDAFFNFDAENKDHQIVLTGRLPRVIATLFVGACLAIAGSLMQGITRNYLASPSLMGVNDGSAFVITLLLVFMPSISNITLVLFSMVGSALGAALVYGMAMLIRNGLSPVRLAIIGTIVGAFLSSIATAVAMYFQISQTISSWYNSKLYMVSIDMIWLTVPFGLVGIVMAIFISRYVTLISLGEDIATGLGAQKKFIKIVAMVAVVLLTGPSVALVGKIAFVGLIIPHVVRMLIGSDYERVIPYSALVGAAFLLACDVISRFINAPFETPIGVVTALIGVPFFFYLIRKKGGAAYA